MNVLVLGLGRSGLGSLRLLLKKKFNVISVDNVNDVRILDLDINYIIKSPGIYNDNLIIMEAKKRGIHVISDIELAYLLEPMKYIAITGTNGKSTVTTLVYEMLKDKAVIGGNIGLSICEQVMDTVKEYAVTELSSFQLDDISAFKPYIACILNLDDDHLKYHGSIENYHKAKLKIINNFKENDKLICHKDIYDLVKDRNLDLIMYDKSFVKDNKIIVDDFKISTYDLKVVGMHNYLNIVASILIAKQVNVDNATIKKVIKEFKGLPYRLEYVDIINNKVVYNDSKSTNVDSTNKAVEAFNESIILLIGGYDKGQDYENLNLNNVVKVIAFGASASRIAETIKHADVFEKLEDALKYALNQNGNVVLFSPGHSSYDQFSSFEERGKYFNDLCLNLRND